MYIVSLLILYFLSYAFSGWVSEIIYNFVTERRFHNAGFLTLPILPIYGFGGIAITTLVAPYINNPFVVFVLSVAIASITEYIGHWLIDKIFHIRLWDYRKKRFNIHGRVCLENSLGFGILALLLVYIIQPFLTTVLFNPPVVVVITLAIILTSLLVIDFANSVITLIRLRTTTVKGTLREAERTIIMEIGRVAMSKIPIKVRFQRIRILLLKLHKLNIKRLHSAFPNAIVRNN